MRDIFMHNNFPSLKRQGFSLQGRFQAIFRHISAAISLPRLSFGPPGHFCYHRHPANFSRYIDEFLPFNSSHFFATSFVRPSAAYCLSTVG